MIYKIGMSDIAGPSNHDYTEGASAIDISNAVSNSRRGRRDSQYSFAYDDAAGSMFSGPGHSVIPSSVSRMTHTRSLSRHRSEDSHASHGRGTRRRGSSHSRADSMGATSGEDEEEEDITGERPLMRRGRKSPSPHRSGVFENIAHLFGRDKSTAAEREHSRRPSFSQRSTASSRRRWRTRSDAGSVAVDSDEEEDGDDRWGYSSGEEDEAEASGDEDVARSPSPAASMDYGSNPPSPTHSAHLPLLSADQFFGDEARIEIDLEPLDPPPPGPPSRQIIYITEEDTSIRFVGYETMFFRKWVWRALCILSFGVLGLLGHWFPKLWLRWVAKEKAFRDLKEGFVVVEVSFFTNLSLHEGSQGCN